MSVRAASRTSFDRRLIAPMVLGSTLNPVNSSIIAVSLVPIGHALGASPSRTAWLVSSLYLATAIGQPVVGRLIDVLGPRRLYLIGTAMVGVAGLIGLLAQDLWVLVAARVVLGFGTCAGYPAAMSLIRSEARRTGEDSPAGILTLLAIANQTVAVIGPTIGGLLIAVGGWRSTFAVNIPLSLVCLWLGSRRLPLRTPPADDADRPPRVDYAGVALFSSALVSLLFFLMEPQTGLLPLLVVTAVAAAGFAAVESRVAAPFIDVRLLRGNLPLVATYVRGLLTMTVSYTFIFGVTQWMQEGRGLDPSTVGLVIMPMFGTAIAISALTGRRPEIRGKLIVGAAVQVAACAVVLALDDSIPIWVLLALTLLLGVPQGLLGLGNQNAVYHQADPARTASSAGLLRTFMYLGAIVASAATGGFLHDGATETGLHHLGLFILGVSTLMLLCTVLDRSLARVGRPATTALS
ncbi:MFS transporter [Nocardioides conyzicola]|uniref:MFS transporter n=1 Tax=Nocardioides conyzicola TaxID=1651781 RepID=A0ABP8WTY8_9ACTN